MSQLRKIKKRSEFPAWCADAWTMHQIFRELGLPADDLFLDIANTSQGKEHVRVVAKEGAVEFAVSVGPAGMSYEDGARHWKRFVTHMNLAPEAEMKAVAASSRIWKELPRLELILKMIDKGFTLACLPPEHQETLREWRRKNPFPAGRLPN